MRYSWNDFVQEVRLKIKQVSEAYGGDDPVWLAAYTDDVIAVGDLDGVMASCEALLAARRGTVLILNKDDFPRMEDKACLDGVNPTVMDSRHSTAMSALAIHTKTSAPQNNESRSKRSNRKGKRSKG